MGSDRPANRASHGKAISGWEKEEDQFNAGHRVLKKRPWSVIVIGSVFVAAGLVGLAYHGSELRGPFRYEIVWVCLIRLAAVLGGMFLLRGHGWARWLLVGWMAYHLVLSGFHSVAEFGMHGLLFGIIGYFLFRPEATGYLRSKRPRGESRGAE